MNNENKKEKKWLGFLIATPIALILLILCLLLMRHEIVSSESIKLSIALYFYMGVAIIVMIASVHLIYKNIIKKK